MVPHLPNTVPVQLYWVLAILMAATALGGGCGGNSAAGEPQSRDSAADVGDSAAGGNADAGATCPTPQKAPSFAQDVKPFLNARCTICHSTHPRDGGFAPSAQNFETYAGFEPWAQDSLASLLQGTMPPPESDPAPPAADICMLKAWIDQGAQDN